MGQIRKIRPASPYSLLNPQDGFWWHHASPGGVAAFENPQAIFGIITTETSGSALAQLPCIRCCPSREQVEIYAKQHPGGQILRIDPTKLQAAEWMGAGIAGDRHVLGSAVKRDGIANLIPLD